MLTFFFVKLCSEMEGEGAEVRERLFIGSLAAAGDLGWLQARGITHVLTVAWGIAPFFVDVPKKNLEIIK